MRLALEQGPAATGFSSATLATGLDSFFKQLTKENFHALLEQDLGHVIGAMIVAHLTPAKGKQHAGELSRILLPAVRLQAGHLS